MIEKAVVKDPSETYDEKTSIQLPTKSGRTLEALGSISVEKSLDHLEITKMRWLPGTLFFFNSSVEPCDKFKNALAPWK